MSKTTQRRAAVAALSFALGAAGTIPAFAAHSDASDASAPDAVSGLGDTLSNLPFVSFLPGQDTSSGDATDTSGNFADPGSADSGPLGGLPLVGGLVSSLPIVGSGGGLGGLPIVGGLVQSVGGLAGGLPVVGPLASGLPVVGPMIGGASTGAGLGGTLGGLPLVGGIVSSLPIVGGGGGLASGGGLPIVGGLVSSLPIVGGGGGGLLGGLLGGGLPLVGGLL